MKIGKDEYVFAMEFRMELEYMHGCIEEAWIHTLSERASEMQMNNE